MTYSCGVYTHFSTSVMNARVSECEKGVLDELAGCEGEGRGVSGWDAKFEGVKESWLREECAGLCGNEVGEAGRACQ